jgi:hypothetical protein
MFTFEKFSWQQDKLSMNGRQAEAECAVLGYCKHRRKYKKIGKSEAGFFRTTAAYFYTCFCFELKLQRHLLTGKDNSEFCFLFTDYVYSLIKIGMKIKKKVSCRQQIDTLARISERTVIPPQLPDIKFTYNIVTYTHKVRIFTEYHSVCPFV